MKKVIQKKIKQIEKNVDDDDCFGWIYVCSSRNLINKNIYKIGSNIHARHLIRILNKGICKEEESRLQVMHQWFVSNCNHVVNILHEKYHSRRVCDDFFKLSDHDVQNINKFINMYNKNKTL